jgi:hypothetical protein
VNAIECAQVPGPREGHTPARKARCQLGPWRKNRSVFLLLRAPPLAPNASPKWARNAARAPLRWKTFRDTTTRPGSDVPRPSQH